MFTGGNRANLLREAERKAQLKEPPLTFLGRRGDGKVGTDEAGMVREIDKFIDDLAASPDASRYLEKSFELLVKEDSRREDGREWDGRLLTCMYLIVKTAVRKRVPLETVKRDMLVLNFEDELVDMLVAKLHEQRRVLERRNAAAGGYPGLDKLEWRVDVVVSSSKEKTIRRPLVMLKMTLTDGSVRTFQVTEAKFQLLRYNLAKMLQHIQDLESHPMMRIMELLEKDQYKKL